MLIIRGRATAVLTELRGALARGPGIRAMRRLVDTSSYAVTALLVTDLAAWSDGEKIVEAYIRQGVFPSGDE